MTIEAITQLLPETEAFDDMQITLGYINSLHEDSQDGVVNEVNAYWRKQYDFDRYTGKVLVVEYQRDGLDVENSAQIVQRVIRPEQEHLVPEVAKSVLKLIANRQPAATRHSYSDTSPEDYRSTAA